MNYGSLFSGIGGFDLALDRAGFTCEWQCEIDKAASAVLAHHWPNVENKGDVRNVRRDNTKPVDLICGGFPCQDLSIAGKRAGLAGERSGLWFEFARIIDELEPQWVVIENVPGLLSSNRGRDFAVIVGWLAKRGYGVAYRILDAQYFGVAQRRRRVFVVASLGDGRAAEVLFERESSSGDTAPSREAGEGIPPDVANGINNSGLRGRQPGSAPSLVSNTLQAHHYRDNQEATYIAFNADRDGIDTLNNISPTLTHKGDSPEAHSAYQKIAIAFNPQSGGDMRLGLGDIPTALQANQISAVAFTQNQRNEVRDLKDKAGALASEPGVHQQNYIAFQPGNLARGTGAEPNKNIFPALRAEPGDQFQHVAWQNRQQSGEVRVQNDTVPSVTKQWGTGGNNVPFVGVRRLTPTECERLQGFPDGWTAGQSDSTRYRQLGNAVCVNVVQWIAERIARL